MRSPLNSYTLNKSIMKRNIYNVLSGVKQGLFTLAATVFLGTAYSQTYTLSYTGSVQTLSLSPGSYSIQAWGADGGDALRGTGGKGGYSEGTITLSSPTTYYIYVGGKGSTASAPTAGGWNGGGGFTGTFSSGYNGGTGGGGTDIRTTMNTTYANRIIVAGGGGGATGYSTYTGNGGNGGGTTGVAGTSSRGLTYAGGGGTQSAGGTAATGGINGYSMAGGSGTGGDYVGTLGGTAGGGGYYGGGSGHWGGAGGGGSGYIGGVTGGITAQLSQPGFVANPDPSGNGLVVITALCNVNVSSTASSICAGTTVTLTTNAVSNYTWSTGNTSSSAIAVTPTSTTTYSVTGTGSNPAGCTGSAMITITVDNTPTVTIAASSTTLCPGAAVTLTTSGATTYTWASGSTNTVVTYTPAATTNYTVTGTNACGTASAGITVTVNTVPVTASASSTMVCAGSSATLTAGGATTYTWAPQGGQVATTVVTPTATTVYTVSGTSSGCTRTATVQLTSVALPTVTAVASPTGAVCAGSPVVLNASSGTATSYTWMPAGGNTATTTVMPSANTVYTVTGSNGSCSAKATVTVNVLAGPVLTAMASRTLICTNESAVLTASTSATSYTWSGNAGSATTMSVTVSPTVTSNYTVTVSDGTCTAQATVGVSVSPCTGLEDLASVNEVAVYPNPTNGIVNIAITNGLLTNSSIEVYDAVGKLVLRETLSKQTSLFDLNRLEGGAYFYKIIHNSQPVKVGKLVKQ